MKTERDIYLRKIRRIYDEPNPYTLLKTIADFMAIFGIVIIVFGWIGGFIVLSIFGNTIVDTFNLEMSQNFITSLPFISIYIILGIISTIPGILLIASSQVIMVIMDIRNDTNATMRLTAELGLVMVNAQDEDDDVEDEEEIE